MDSRIVNLRLCTHTQLQYPYHTEVEEWGPRSHFFLLYYFGGTKVTKRVSYYIRNPESATRKHNNRSAVINNRSAVINNWPVTNKVCSSHKYCTIVFHCCDINKFCLCHKYVSVSVRTPTNSSAGYFSRVRSVSICFALCKFFNFWRCQKFQHTKNSQTESCKKPTFQKRSPQTGPLWQPKRSGAIVRALMQQLTLSLFSRAVGSRSLA